MFCTNINCSIIDFHTLIQAPQNAEKADPYLEIFDNWIKHKYFPPCLPNKFQPFKRLKLIGRQIIQRQWRLICCRFLCYTLGETAIGRLPDSVLLPAECLVTITQLLYSMISHMSESSFTGNSSYPWQIKKADKMA